MSIFTALTNKYSLEEAFKATDYTSAAMRDAIQEWFSLYYDRPATKDSDPCQRIAATVVNKITKACFSEYTADSKDEYAAAVLSALDDCKNTAMQISLVGGEAFLKPVPVGDRWVFNVIRRDSMLVFGRDAFGVPNDIGTIEVSTHGRFFYALLERRFVDEAGRLTIRNRLFRSETKDVLGREVPLDTLEQYAMLQPEYTYPEPLNGVGLVHMKVPVENTVDGSLDGVSVYAAAVGLIHNIDRNEALINGEFERGQSKVFASADLMRRDKNGHRKFDGDLFVALDDSPDEVGVTIFSPELRVASFHERKQEYLRNVETVIGIKRGLLSEVEAVERTATEITSSAGDYNLTITSFQAMWTKAVLDAVKLCGYMGKVYNVTGAHDVADDAVVIDYGNGILYDEGKAWADYMALVSAGLLKPEIALGWKFNMPTETEADLQKIRKKYMPDMEAQQEPGAGDDE